MHALHGGDIGEQRVECEPCSQQPWCGIAQGRGNPVGCQEHAQEDHPLHALEKVGPAVVADRHFHRRARLRVAGEYAAREGKHGIRPEIGDPGDGLYVLRRLAQYNGIAEEVTDEEIVNGILALAKTEGIFTEPAGGVSVAALKKLFQDGRIDKDENIVCYVTGNGLKATEAIVDVLPKPDAVKPDIQVVSALIR